MRSFGTTINNQLDDGRIAVAGLIKFVLGSGSYGFAKSVEPITYSALEYKPLGLISVSDIAYVPGTVAQDFLVRLPASPDDGFTPAVLQGFWSEDYRGRAVTVMDAHFNIDTGALVDVITMRAGYIDQVRMRRTRDGGAVFEAECLSRAIDYSRQNGRLANHEDQQRRSAGDLFYQHLSETGRVQTYWGRNRPQ